MEQNIKHDANIVVKEELANKNSIDLNSTDNKLIASRLQAIDILGSVIKDNLKEGINDDYAVIPNTSKPALLQAGADKICLLYGITKEYPMMNIDKENKLVTAKCELYFNGNKVSESYGASAIGTQRDYGWELNKAIKIAQKRAKVGAVVGIANLSKIFTQDTEDMTPEKTYTEADKKATYEVCNKWKDILHIKCFNRQQFKDAWTRFTRDVKDLMGLDNAYELGANKELADKFLEEMKHPHTIKDPNEELGERIVGTLGTETEEIYVHQPSISDEQIANYGKKKAGK